MYASAEALADETKPGDAGVGGFRHRALHVEMKHRLGAAGALLSEPLPAGITGARGAVAHDALAHEIDIGVIVVGQWRWKSSRKAGQSGLRPFPQKITQREREAVIDADQCRRVLGKPFHQPFGNAAPRPVFAR
jgi:hypothetical protein